MEGGVRHPGRRAEVSLHPDEERRHGRGHGDRRDDTLTFSESFEFQGNQVPITYRGVIAGDEIKFVRKVADFATEEFVAKREKSAGA
jgi:hypothetical protein